MQLSEVEFACEWCGNHFVRRHQRGRHPLYCTRSCRQRAYEERRRGAYTLGLPKATMVDWLHPTPKHYQAGMGGQYLTIAHALRPDGAADRIGWRPALCGARVRPANRPFYVQGPLSGNRNCETCTSVAHRFPPQHRIEPLSDIGTVLAMIARLRAARPAPEPTVRALVDQLLACFGAPAGASLERRVAQMTSH
jgi:hypothetical protein